MEGTTEQYADNPLGFGLELFGGRGVLCAKDQQIGPLDLKLLELEIPELEFPFDISGGPNAFKSRRCVLRHLTLGLPAESLSEALNSNRLHEQGFSNLRLGFREGFLEIAGSMSYQSKKADFSSRVSFSLRDAHLLHIIFHDIRIYGPFGLPACMIPVYLRRGLGLPYLHAETCASWEFQPTGEFLRSVLPRMGWKVPDYQDASIITAAVGQEQLLLVCGDNPLSDAPELVVSETSLKGTYAAEAMGIFRAAEQALANGEIDLAYRAYQRFLGSEQAGPWVKNRLLQLGSAIESCHSDALELANTCLAEDPKNSQALLALGNIAQWKGNHEEAAGYYSRLSSEANQNRNRFNRIHADLAAGLACEGFDCAQAITHYENAASRDKNSVTAYDGIFRLRCQSEDWVGAKRAGERLVRLDLASNDKARIWCELATIYGDHFKDFKAARQGFERALREEEDYEAALEGLAQTFIARGEPSRAITFLTRLLEKGRAERRAPRVVELGVRLGLLWENELGDLDAAIEHYQLVIAIDRRNRAARLNLADIYLKRSQFRHARALLDDLISITQEDERLEILPDYIAANMGLAALIESTDGANWEVLECLDRVLERAPHHEAALEMIAPLLRANQKWERLADILMAMAQGEGSSEERLPLLLECAELYQSRIERPDDARTAFEKALDLSPADDTALEGVRSLLENDEHLNSFGDRLEKAAHCREDLEQKAQLLTELARLRVKLGHPVKTVIEAYHAALDAWPRLDVSARELCGLYERVIDPPGHANALLRLYQATDDDVEKAEALIKRGKLLWPKLDQPEAAAESFREALDIDSMLLDAWLSLAEVLENTGAVKRAVTVLESSVKALKDHAEDCMVIYERLARLARDLDSPDLECQYLEKSIELGGPEDIICGRFLEVLEKLERHDDAADYMVSWARRGNILDSSNLFLDAILIFHSVNDSVRSVGLCMELIEAGEEKVHDLDDNSETVRCALEAARLLERIYRDVVHPEGIIKAIRHQLALAPTEYTETLERLILAQIAGEDLEAAEASTQTLLKHCPESRLAHGFLARQSDNRGEYLRALNHWECFLTSSEPVRELHEDLVRAYERAASLAHEVAPALLETLYRLFSIDFREGEQSYTTLNVPPLGDILLEHEQFDEFVRLRKWQLENSIPGDAFARKWDIASVYHRNLNRGGDAIVLYREVAEHPDHSNTYVQDACESLLELFQERKEWRDLSQILLELADRATSSKESLQLGLRAADVLAREMGDRAAARFVFHGLIKQHTEPDEANAILDALRGYEFDEEAGQMLARSLEGNWNVEDGRFAELLRLYNSTLDCPDKAIALARRAIEIQPEQDLAWWTLISLCEENPSLGNVNTVLEDWIKLSEGEQRLSLLRELYGRVEDANPEPRDEEATVELVELLSQIIAFEETPLNSLEKLAALYEHAGDTAKYLAVLERIVESQEPGEAQDLTLNRVFVLGDELLDDDSLRIHALERLAKPSEAQWARLGELLFKTEQYDRLLDYREETSSFETEVCLELAKHWLEDFELDNARFYFDHFLAKDGDPDTVWSLASDVWPSADRLEELGRWRIQWADSKSGVKPNSVRILGAAQIIDAIRSKDSTPSTLDTLKAELVSKIGIERDFSVVNFDSVDQAWAAYVCALICEFPDWVERSGESLESLLGEDDLRLGEVLVNRYHHKIEAEE